jgi:two-component system chemotaxis response regulator CheY
MTKTILLADDSTTSRMIVGQCLQSAGYEVLEARDGNEALDLLDGRPIHLVVSDLVMPRLDGLGLARATRELTPYRFTPILMLTSVTREDLKSQGRALGIRAWLAKPVQAAELLDAVARLLGT